MRTEGSVLTESLGSSATAPLATQACCVTKTLMSASLLPAPTDSVLTRRTRTAVCVTRGTRAPIVNCTSMSVLETRVGMDLAARMLLMDSCVSVLPTSQVHSVTCSCFPAATLRVRTELFVYRPRLAITLASALTGTQVSYRISL